jgi:glyoxylase I family protein
VPGLHHLAIQVADLPACERFYREVLGLAVLRRWPDGSGGDRSVWLSLGGEGGGEAFLALERVGSAPTVEPGWSSDRPGLHLVALRIPRDERAAWVARLAARGVGLSHQTRFTLYVRDPEGNRVGLSHWPEEAP